MTKCIGWVLLTGSYVWFCFLATEPTLLQVVGAASVLIAGAILAK